MSSDSIVPVIEPVVLKQRFDVRVGEWGFHLNLNTGKFEIYRAGRPDLAHLTIMWGTASGDLDVHLTYEHEAATSDTHPKKWIPLFTFPKARLEDAGIHFNEAAEQIMVPHLLRSYRKFRPGWLAHRDYFVRVIDRETMISWIRDLAPKRRRKHRFDPQRLDPEHYPPEMLDSVYDPRILHYLEGDELKAPVSATRVRRGHVVRQDGILLYFTLGPDGTKGWWGMKQRDVQAMGREMSRYMFDNLVPLVRPEHAEIWEQIVAGLGMDDFEETRSMAHTVRQFLTSPRNPVGQPYPGPPGRVVAAGAQFVEE